MLNLIRLASRAEGGRGLGGKESGEALASFSDSHRAAPAILGCISQWVEWMDMDVRILYRLLSGQTLVQVKTENEMFKRNVVEREREQKKEYRKMREGIKKKEQQMEKQV